MNAFCRNLITATSLALLPGLIAFSQTNGVTTPVAGVGTVILHSGDTLDGRVNWRMKYVENNPTEIKFIPKNGPSAIYKASDLAEIIVYPVDFETDEPMPPENYVSLPSMKRGEPVFYNRMINGKVQVFQNRSSVVTTHEVSEITSEFDGIEFRWSKKEGLTVGPTYKVSSRVLASKTRFSSYFISKNKAPLVKVDRDNYDALFQQLFGDCPEIQNELTKNPDLRKFKNFMILAEVYDQLCR